MLVIVRYRDAHPIFGGRFLAIVGPPTAKEFWQTDLPMEKQELFRRLVEVGCHVHDVHEAFHDAERAANGAGWVR